MTVPFANNLDFLEAVALLVDLQFAICEENEERADTLRDALEVPLGRLSWEANEWLRGLSGDLDMLCDQEVFEPNDLLMTDYQARLSYAWRNIENEPQAILVLLRKEQTVLLPHAVAYSRGRSYSLLGFRDVGTLFLRRAVELNPGLGRYKIILLGNLWSGGHLDQAISLAETILREEASPEIVLLAAGVMIQALRATHSSDRKTFGMLRRKIEAAMSLIPAGSPDLASLGFTLLGIVAETLNRMAAAKEQYSRACFLKPDDGTPFLLRGRLMLKLDKPKALADFRHAVDLGATDPLACLVLARESLQAGDYDDCQAMSRLAAQSENPATQGQAYEILAIAEAQVPENLSLAEHHFEEAHKLFPSSTTIQANRAALKQVQKIREGNSHYLFDLPDESKAMDGNPLDLTLQARSRQLWAANNPLFTPLGMAA